MVGSGWDDLGTVLHEEIARLPARYRNAVVLCDLEGLTQEQAAQRLGCPSGTVRSRLARGRGRLQARLRRRGLAPAAGGLAALLTAEAVTAEVPAALASQTARAATLAAAGKTVAGAVSATALTGAVLRTMFMSKLRIVAAGLLLIGAGAGGTGVMVLQQESGRTRTEQAAVPAIAETEPRSTQQSAPGAAGPVRTAETPQDDIPNQGETQLRETELKRAVDRLIWSLRMNARGYVADSALLKDHEGVEKAILALERVRAKEKPRAKLPEEESPEERRRDEISVLTKEIDRVQAESRWAELSLHRLARFLPPSGAERELAEAEVAAARALCELKKAQLKVLELRLSQTKQK
jgi:hypothetical protein